MKIKNPKNKKQSSPFSDDQCVRNMVTLLCKFLQGDLLTTNRDILVLSMVNRRINRMVTKHFKVPNSLSLSRLIKKDHTIGLFMAQVACTQLDLQKYQGTLEETLVVQNIYTKFGELINNRMLPNNLLTELKGLDEFQGYF